VLFLLTPFGRVSRRGFWLGYVALFAAFLAGAWYGDRRLAVQLPTQSPLLEPFAWAVELAGGPFILAVIVILPWVTMMMILKRLHDRGFGGFMLVWKMVLLGGLGWLAFNARTLTPPPWGGILEVAAGVVALLMVLRVLAIVLFLRGQEGENRYGPDPIA
jgi:uncharacterized membrane protein YhaH (DUF805 family)